MSSMWDPGEAKDTVYSTWRKMTRSYLKLLLFFPFRGQVMEPIITVLDNSFSIAKPFLNWLSTCFKVSHLYL